MNWNPRDLPKERPSSFDDRGKRLFLYPASVKGKFRKRRNWIYSVLVLIFLVLPWTEFGGEQTILLSLMERRFVFFGNTFWAHDGPLIFFPLMLAVLSLVFVTSIWGRLWCGWACPQTVFIDFLFRRVEELVEGNHLKRRSLDSAPWSLSKVVKKTVKWSLFLVMASHISHSFTAYFVGSSHLFWVTTGSPTEHWGLFVFVQAFTLVLLFDFGWFREQFCMIMCPYGRFQSVLMGRQSLAVVYDEKRGEPRRGLKKSPEGDCVNCFRCVQVCPTGIDIRRGVQMECVTCTACIDACDDIMRNLNKPEGLIRYASESEISGKRRTPISRRSGTYLTIIIGMVLTFAYVLSTRPDLHVKIVRALESPYTVVGETAINHFRLNVVNQAQSELGITSVATDLGEVVSPGLPLSLKPGERKEIHFFVKVPTTNLIANGRLGGELDIHFRKSGYKRTFKDKLVVLGPMQ